MTFEKEYYSTASVTLRNEIYQSNVFLQAQKNFDLLGMRLLLIAMSGINPHFSKNDKYYDKEFKMVFIPTAKLTELLGSSKYLGSLPKACLKLTITTMKLANNNDFDSKLFNIFKKIDYRPHEGLYVCFNDVMRPHLLDLLYAKKGYTKVNVHYLLSLTSLYAVRLLEILLQYQNIPHYKRIMEIQRIVTVEDLRFMLNVPEGAYKNRPDNFKKHVLDIPIKEINDNTPYFLQYKVIKKGTKIVAFKFILSTHEVPFKVKGQEPKFSNDAIDYLREMGFTDVAARKIFNKCKGVIDCLVRARRADVLLSLQKTKIRNRLGFLRKAIEEDWHSNSMPEKEDPYSKPGWSARIDFHSRRPGVPLRAPKRKIERPPNVLPQTKMDKQLADAIAKGEFYTPDVAAKQRAAVADKSTGKNDLTSAEQGATVADKSAGKNDLTTAGQGNPVLTVDNSPESAAETSPKEVYSSSETDAYRQNESVTATENEPPASEFAQSESVQSEIEQELAPQPQGGESYYNETADKRAKLAEHFKAGPEEYQRALEQDFEEEMRELAEKKARQRAEFEKKRPSMEQFVDSVVEAANKKSGEWTPLGDVLLSVLSCISPERIAKRRAEREAAAQNGTAQSDDAPMKKIEDALKFMSSPATVSPPKPKPPEPSTAEETEERPPIYAYILSPTEKTLATGGSAMYKRYKELYERLCKIRIATMDDEELQLQIRLVNEKRALEKELLEKGEIIPYKPPMPKRDINIPLPPPPPPDYEKNTSNLTKTEKLYRRSIKELVELYTEANRLNEEPEHILARTNGPDVKKLDVRYDTTEAMDYLLVDNVKLNIAVVIRHLELREVLERWRQIMYFFVEGFKTTPVDFMRRYIKTFGYLPPLYEPTPKEWEHIKKCQKNVYTGEYLSDPFTKKTS